MREIYRDCVSGLVVSADNKILMGMKDPHGGGVYADCWHLPGGGVEPNETQLAALSREIMEEVGLDIASPASVWWMMMALAVRKRPSVAQTNAFCAICIFMFIASPLQSQPSRFLPSRIVIPENDVGG